MGSLDEEELFRMGFDFTESESPSPTSSCNSNGLPLGHHHTHHTLQEILGCVGDNEVEVLEKVFKGLRSLMSAGKTADLKKWLVRRLRMDGYDASLCRTSWVGTFGCPGGDYEYIDVMMKEENGGSMRFIVDIDFKSQFELAMPTQTYRELTNRIPTIFVGREDKLNKIIHLLCSAAKQSLKERGLHIPPWRRTSYMLSKWFSDCQKVSTTPLMITPKREVVKDTSDARSCAHGSPKYGKWVPPTVKHKRREFGSGSALSSQFSNMSINCW